MLVNIHNKQHRKVVESFIILIKIISNKDPGFFNLSSYLVKLIQNSYNIPLNYFFN